MRNFKMGFFIPFKLFDECGNSLCVGSNRFVLQKILARAVHIVIKNSDIHQRRKGHNAVIFNSIGLQLLSILQIVAIKSQGKKFSHVLNLFGHFLFKSMYGSTLFNFDNILLFCKRFDNDFHV